VVPLRITRYDAADAAVVITCPEPGITVVRLAVTQHEWEDASCDVWLSAEEARHLARLLARAADSRAGLFMTMSWMTRHSGFAG